MLTKNKIIIFDLDGVIFDTVKMSNDYLRDIFPNISEESLTNLLCGNFFEGFEKLKKTTEFIKESPEDEQMRKHAYSEKKKNAQMFLGIKELLFKLKDDGYLLTINTSAYEKNCTPLLEKNGVAEKFDFIASAEISRSKVEKFKLIIEKFQTEKHNAIFITDTLGDLREADISDISTIAVSWGAHSQHFFEIEEHKNYLGMVNSVDRLYQLIKTKLPL